MAIAVMPISPLVSYVNEAPFRTRWEGLARTRTGLWLRGEDVQEMRAKGGHRLLRLRRTRRFS